MKKCVTLMLILVTVFVGCSQRDNPAEPTISRGNLYTGFVNSSSLEESLVEQVAGRYIYIYEPSGYTVNNIDSFEIYVDSVAVYGIDSVHFDTTFVIHQVTDTDYPSLYLLHGFGGYFNYYVDLFMIKDILDEMISTGEIIPMVVITPDCYNSFGGSFYTNSPEFAPGAGISFSGNYEDFIINDLIEYINISFNVDTTASKRGISGHSMGGYGAMKLAMKYPELYGSVSSMSAPLAFSGFEALLPYMYAENNFTPNDTAAFYNIEPSADKQLTSMMFAMGAAFSPHNPYDADTSYFHRLLENEFYFGVDLPFNIAGELVTDTSVSMVWHKWLENDPLTMLLSGGYTALAGKPIYIDAGDADDLGFNLQGQGFSQALTQMSISHAFIEYSGYSGVPADHSSFVAERLREILKFHSDAFSAAE